MRYGGRVVRISKGFGVRRHALAACIALLLAGCSTAGNSGEPYLVQIDCAVIMASEDYEKRPNEQVVTLWFSDGTSRQEQRPGRCLQTKRLYPLQP